MGRAEPTGSWRVRVAGPGDAQALTLLHLDVWDDAYADLMPAEVLAARREGVAERVAERRRSLEPDGHQGREPTLVAEDPGGALIGFAVAGKARDDSAPASVELMALYVRATWWGVGVGRDLLVAALGDRAAYLWVLAGNDRATTFYRRQGFELDGVGKDEDHGLRHLRMTRRPALPA